MSPVRRRSPRRGLLSYPLAGVLGVCAALLVSCSGSTKGLIPASLGGPLRGDFREVDQAAVAGNGSCSSTETAVAKTEQDFAALPSSVDSGLRNTLRQGIENLRSRALVICAEPTTSSSATSTVKTSTSTTSTTTPTTSTPTVTTPTETAPTNTTTAPGEGGGVVAPGQTAPSETPPTEEHAGGVGPPGVNGAAEAK